MPTNEFVKASTVINTALGLLQREIVIPNLLWLNGFGDFAGAKDDTISIRVPGRLGSRTKKLRATGADRKIQTDTIKQTKVDVTLTDDVYNAVPITDEELSLDIKDFGVEILNPQVRGVAEGLENGAVDCMRDATYQAVVIIDKTKVYDSFVDARKALNDENVPFGQRGAVVGSGIEAAILKDPNFKQADQAGSDSALREAIIGKIAGFTVVVSNALDDDEGYVFHKTAYAWSHGAGHSGRRELRQVRAVPEPGDALDQGLRLREHHGPFAGEHVRRLQARRGERRPLRARSPAAARHGVDHRHPDHGFARGRWQHADHGQGRRRRPGRFAHRDVHHL